jgi:hypothetical protein
MATLWTAQRGDVLDEVVDKDFGEARERADEEGERQR